MRSLCLFVFALLAVASCTKDAPPDNTCANNTDCTAPGTRCDVLTKQCVCGTDEACGDGMFCNRSGICQLKSGCAVNADCTKPNTYCDIASGSCLDGPALMLTSQCGLASHCPFGSTCRDGVCVESCFDDGDCALGDICHQGLCAGGQNLCSSDDFCEYGQLCSDATDPGQCRVDRRGPYCRGCSPRFLPQNPEPCDHPRNFCLINSLESGGFQNFCGVDCSLGQECPNGYECHGVVVLTDDICQSTADCRCDRATITVATATCAVAQNCDPRRPDGTPDENAGFCFYAGQSQCNPANPEGKAACIVPRGGRNGFCECGMDSDCPNNGTCVDGRCCGRVIRDEPDRVCFGGENRVSGFCGCATDSDCMREACDGSRGACQISGQPCEPGGNDCGQIECAEGGCLIGRNCAPVEGLACSIVAPHD